MMKRDSPAVAREGQVQGREKKWITGARCGSREDGAKPGGWLDSMARNHAKPPGQPLRLFHPDWRRDLNRRSCCGERSCVDSAGTADPRAALFEHGLEAATPIPEIGKPFDVLAEGLISEKSRGDRTPLELFLAGIRGWEAGLRRQMDGQK